jgi:TetR/AcrR family transcriptional regulator, transcriptional repressor for nem operon
VRKGERTRGRIVERAAGVFNCNGYAGASVSAIMAATGLQKGGIYRHFGSKEQLAGEAYAWAAARMRERFAAALAERRHVGDRLHAIVDVFEGVVTDPPVEGGCPVLSAAAESDYGVSPVREQVRETMRELRELVRVVVAAGVGRGELRPETEPEDVATVVVAAAEGGILLSQLYEDSAYVRQVAAHLHDYIDARLVKRDAMGGTDDRNGNA